MKTPRYIRTLCMLLVFVLLVQLLPARALAAGADETLSQERAAAAAQGETASEPAHIVHEIPDKRTEYSKEYRLSNGLHMAAVYGESIHYAKDGQWQEIDNTLGTKGRFCRPLTIHKKVTREPSPCPHLGQ